MNELKTLKDLKQKEDDIGDVRYNLGMENLRKEAIKWIKSNKRIIRIIVGYKEERIGTGGDFEYIKNPITKNIKLDRNLKNFIKHFFNITEEDLLIEDIKNTKVPKFKQKLSDLKNEN